MRGATGKWLAMVVLLAAPAALAARVYEPRLRLLLEERYDADFRLLEEGAGGQFMTKVIPTLGLEVKDPTLRAEGFYAADLLVRHGSGNVTLDHRAGLDVQKALSSRLRVGVMGRIYRVVDSLSLPRETVTRSTDPILYGQARLSLSGRLSRRWEVRAGYDLEGARVLMGEQGAGSVHVPYVEGWFSATRRLGLGTEYRYQALLSGEGSARAHGLSAALRYRLTRHMVLTARAGSILYSGREGAQDVLPRVRLELEHEGQAFELGVAMGHELVGSGDFTHALWADHASAVLTRRLGGHLSAFIAGSVFRNGRAPGEDVLTLMSSQTAQGYALGTGVEYRLNRYVSLQGAANRIAQTGAPGLAAGVDLARNILAVRLHISAW